MFHLILQIYFAINATVTLFSNVFKSILLVKSSNCPQNCHDIKFIITISYPKKIHRLKNDTLEHYTASKKDIFKLSESPPPRHIFPGVPTLEENLGRGRGCLTSFWSLELNWHDSSSRN